MNLFNRSLFLSVFALVCVSQASLAGVPKVTCSLNTSTLGEGGVNSGFNPGSDMEISGNREVIAQFEGYELKAFLKQVGAACDGPTFDAYDLRVEIINGTVSSVAQIRVSGPRYEKLHAQLTVGDTNAFVNCDVNR